jgi:hypothetical protein
METKNLEDPSSSCIKLSITDLSSSSPTYSPLEDWIVASIYLGKWIKSLKKKDSRQITFLVLPSRKCAPAFIALGAMISSVTSYEDNFSWNKISRLAPGAELFWRRIETGDSYAGKVIGVDEISSEVAIKLIITKSRKVKDINSIIYIPKNQFNKFQFGTEKPVSEKKDTSLISNFEFLKELLGEINQKWAKSDGHDLLLVTNIVKFKSSIENLYLKINNSSIKPISIENLLSFEQLGNGKQSKLKITHPKGILNSSAGLVILDGPNAFSVKEHISEDNDLLIIYDYLEFKESELDFIKEVDLVSLQNSDPLRNLNMEIFPVGYEFCTYSISRG